MSETLGGIRWRIKSLLEEVRKDKEYKPHEREYKYFLLIELLSEYIIENEQIKH